MKKSLGQAIIPLLIVVIIALGLGAVAVELAISNMLVDRYHFHAVVGYYSVESALEEAYLHWLRSPNFTSGSLQVNDASCNIEVSGSSPWIIVVDCDEFLWHPH